MKSTDFITEDVDLKRLISRLSIAFRRVGLNINYSEILPSRQINGWYTYSAKGNFRVKAGTDEVLKFKISAAYNPEGNEMNGEIETQSHHTSKTYDKEGAFNDDQYPLDDIAQAMAEFVRSFAEKETADYNKGLQDYVDKGGRGMMNGPVHYAQDKYTK